MNPIRVLVVDSSAAVRRMLRLAIGEDEMELAGVAANARIALALLEEKALDLVPLDLETPEKDGLTTLRHLRQKNTHLPVVIFSNTAGRATLEALSRGAADYVAKPSTANASAARVLVREQLIPRIKSLCGKPNPFSHLHFATSCENLHGQCAIEVVAIGISTGGPNALPHVVSALTRDLPVPILVVNTCLPDSPSSLPSGFRWCVPCRCERRPAVNPWCREQCGSPWRPSSRGHSLSRAVPITTVAFSSREFLLSFGGCALPLSSQPLRTRSLGDRLAGMGQDGLRGAREIHAAGGRVWAQDANTSTVWSMPGFVIQNGLAQRVLPLSRIGPEIVRTVQENRNTSAGIAPAARKFHERIEYDLRIPGAVGS